MANINILNKEPFTRVRANTRRSSWVGTNPDPVNKSANRVYVSQEDFLCELDPDGHKIYDQEYYPDKIKRDEETGRVYEERVIRVSVPFQQIILIKHLCHLCGNDVQFELASSEISKEEQDLFFDFKKGWILSNMEEAVYQVAKSVKTTGDGAVVGYVSDGKFYTKVLSYALGDVLFPHYDANGSLDLFARKYYSSSDDAEGCMKLDVWDSKYYYQLRESDSKSFSIAGYEAEGFELDTMTLHGMQCVPVAYHRENQGPCWSPSQAAIDNYELAISMLSQNNMAYAFPIMFIKGEDTELEGDMHGAVKAITGGADMEAGFLSRPNGSELFEIQLKVMLQNIFMGSFAVLPPEVKAGDLPGVAVKLLYSPAVEKAMQDALEMGPMIDQLVKVFKAGYGIQQRAVTRYNGLNVYGWLKPYIHQNDSEIITNLAQSVANGFLSSQTASEICPYSKNNEFDRIVKEAKREAEADRLYDIKKTEQTDEDSIDESESEAY